MDEAPAVAATLRDYRQMYAEAERLVPITETVTADQTDATSAIANVERLVPGYTDYLRQSVLRAARLAQTVTENIERVYANVERDDFMVFHFGIEVPLALARTDMELLGRVGAMLRPANIGVRAKAAAGLLHYDLAQLPPEVMRGDRRRETLESLVPALEALTDAEPNRWQRWRDRRDNETEEKWVISHWNVGASRALNYLSKSYSDVSPLYQQLSAAVHGGALVENVIFRPNRTGAVYGYVLLRHVCELLQHELVEMKLLLQQSLRPRS